GRGGGLVFRVGAGLAEFLLDGERGGGQTVPHSGRRVHPDAELESHAENLDAVGCFEPRRPARAGGEENAGIVPLSWNDSVEPLFLKFFSCISYSCKTYILRS